MRAFLASRVWAWVPRHAVALAVGLAVSGLGLARVAVPDPFERLQHYAFDTLQRVFPRQDADVLVPGTGVVVVDIDDASLARHGQWPWSRLLVSRLIGALQDAGARSIGLDIVFAEPDRTSPALLAPTWARQYGLEIAGRVPGMPLPDSDVQLAETIGRGRVVTGYGLVAERTGKAPVLGVSIAYLGREAPAGVPDFGGAVPNLRQLDEAAAGQGSFAVAAGRDEIIRRLPAIMSLDGTLLPSLALETLRVALDPDGALRIREERSRNGGEVIGYTAAVGDLTIPLANDGTIWLHHGARPRVRTLSAAQVLDDDPAILKQQVGGRIVLVGTSAVGLSDLRPTPLSAFEPGVNIHAGAIEQMLSGAVVRRPPAVAGAELTLAAVVGLAVGLVVGRFGARAGAALAASAVAAGLAVTALAFDRANLLLDPSLIIIFAAVAFVVAMLARHFLAERRANALRTAFAHYLSPQLVEALARDPDRLRLGGEERDMTFLFTDLEGFTAFTETADPAVLVATLNAYLDGVCRIAMEHGGTVDKIVGDAVHLMFNAPLDQPDHAARAVRCALAIDAFSTTFAASQTEPYPGRPPFGVTRIGVNTGRAVVGNFGGHRRFDYTAHGDSINTAARLEAANKVLGTRICVAEATVLALGGSDLAMRPIGELALKGKTKPVRVFAPLAADAPEAAWAARYTDAFGRLSRGEADGGAAILELLALYPGDPILIFHARRIRAGQLNTPIATQAA